MTADNRSHHRDTKDTKGPARGRTKELGDLGALVVEVVDVVKGAV